MAAAGVARRVIVRAATPRERDAVVRQDPSQLPVLFGQSLLVLRDIAVELLEPEDFVLEGLDVELFSLPMGAARGDRRSEGTATSAQIGDVTYRWACRLSSCRLVRAGLLSGFGPRRLGGLPSANESDDTDRRKTCPALGMRTTVGPLVGERLEEAQVQRRQCALILCAARGLGGALGPVTAVLVRRQ